LRIATRGSELAQWQARSIAAALSLVDPATRVELVVISTEGDRRRDVPDALEVVISRVDEQQRDRDEAEERKPRERRRHRWRQP